MPEPTVGGFLKAGVGGGGVWGMDVKLSFGFMRHAQVGDHVERLSM